MVGEKIRDTGVAKLGRFLWHYQAKIEHLIVDDDLFARWLILV